MFAYIANSYIQSIYCYVTNVFRSGLRGLPISCTCGTSAAETRDLSQDKSEKLSPNHLRFELLRLGHLMFELLRLEPFGLEHLLSEILINEGTDFLYI